MSIIATVAPASQTRKADSDSVRQASTASGTIFDVSLHGSSFPSGWILLQSMLIRFGGDYDARLYYDLGGGFANDLYFEIPASEKGVINELVCIPEGVRQMKFSPMGNAGEFELGEFRFIKVSPAKRHWLMAKRLMSVLQQENRRRIFFKRFGFLWILTDLHGVYKSAGKLLPHAAAPPYQEWITQFDSLNAQDHAQITSHISRFVSNPDFYILVIADSADSEAVNKTQASLELQLYREFRCAVLEVSGRNIQDDSIESSMQAGISYVDCGNVEEWLQKFNDSLEGKYAQRWVMVVHAGDVLPPQALYQFACSILACPAAAILYSDDDVIDMKGQRSKPRFKPDWSLTHYRSTDYLGNAVAIHGHVAAKAGGVTMDCCLHGNYDLLLRVIDSIGGDGKGEVVHILGVLLHQSEFLDFDAGSRNLTEGGGVEAVKRHLSRNDVIADVSVTYPGCRKIKYQLPAELPLVSIVIPVRDMMEITQRCLESILNKTTYSRFEIIVVDNRSESSEMNEFLEGIAALENVRVLSYDAPFNFSAINNFAVSAAKGEVICMLNNDTEVISPDWLEELVGNLLQTSVGAVGAKLYFSEKLIQHGGDLVGVGNVASHAHKYVSRESTGYCNRAIVAQEYSAVTAACMVTWKSIYEELGGLDEEHLKVAFNDVDYCLRVREAGYKVVWTPHAELYHHESISRGKSSSPEKKRRAACEATYMRKRWRRNMRNDPFYNPNLSYERPDFSLNHFPAVDKPWRK